MVETCSKKAIYAVYMLIVSNVPVILPAERNGLPVPTLFNLCRLDPTNGNAKGQGAVWLRFVEWLVYLDDLYAALSSPTRLPTNTESEGD